MKNAPLPTIFVQIASYRDTECQWTVKDLFEKAKYPNRVHVGICWQYDPDEDEDCFTVEPPLPDNVQVNPYHWKESLGVCWARHEAQKLYEGEDYVLMIDSHMRFVQDWDELLIAELASCPSKKPLLSCHPAAYTPPNNLESTPKPTIMRAHMFSDGDIRFKGEFLDRQPDKPLNGAFVAAGFIFSLGKLVTEVPYDPYLYFNQEEMVLSARFYTHGWDAFSSAHQYLYHYYNSGGDKSGKKRPTHWADHTDWATLQSTSRKRFDHLLGHAASTDPQVLKEIKKYGLGTTRSLDQYSAYCGIDFKNKIAGERALRCLFITDLMKFKDRPVYIPELDEGKAPPAPPQAETTPSHKLSRVVPDRVKEAIKKSYLSDRKPKAGSLLMFSGGLDCVSILAALLTETDHEVHVHHIEIINKENRAEAENESIKKLLAYFKTHYRPFTYTTSRSEFALGIGGGLDISLAMFTAGRVYTATGGGIDFVWTGHIAPSAMEIAEAAAAFNALFTTRRVKPEWLMPLTRLSKLDIYESLPRELANLTWSCRWPVYEENYYRPCGKCHACESMLSVEQAIEKRDGQKPFDHLARREPVPERAGTAPPLYIPPSGTATHMLGDLVQPAALLANHLQPKPMKHVTEGIPPKVLVIENYLDEAGCKILRDYADEQIGIKLKVVDHEKSSKDAVATVESEGRITEHVSIDNMPGEVLSIFNDIYCKQLEPFYKVQFEWYERPQILRYLKGGKYNQHADADHWVTEKKAWVRAQDRDYSVLLYLNEEYEGGELEFTNFKYKIKPKTGMLIGFPSDHQYLHAALPTLSGVRYVIVSWAAILGTPRVRTTPPYASVFLRNRATMNPPKG